MDLTSFVQTYEQIKMWLGRSSHLDKRVSRKIMVSQNANVSKVPV